MLLVEQRTVFLGVVDARLLHGVVDLRVARHDHVGRLARGERALGRGLFLSGFLGGFGALFLLARGSAFRRIRQRLGILGGLGLGLFGGSVGACRQGVLKRVHERLGNLDVGRPAILAVHDGPGGEIEIAAIEKAVVNLVPIVVVLRQLHLALAHAPGGVGVLAQGVQALLLRLLGHVHEQLHDGVPVVHEHLLEVEGNLLVAADDIARQRAAGSDGGALAFRQLLHFLSEFFQLFRLLLNEPEQHLLGRRRVPAAIVERYLATLAERFPELLHQGIDARYIPLGAREILGGLHIDVFGHMHLRGARIQLVNELGNTAALAGSRPTFNEHDQAHALRARLLLQQNELADELVVNRLVFLFRQLLRFKVDFFEHLWPFFHRSFSICHAHNSELDTGIYYDIRT